MGSYKTGLLVLTVLALAGCCGHGCHQHVYQESGNEPNSVEKSSEWK